MKTSRNPYSIKDHLGNVRVTFADKKIPANNQLLDFYTETQSVSTYYPFGWEVKPLSWAFDTYRFGYNNKEKDEDIGDWIDYGERMYLPKIARFPMPDPIIVYEKKYPELSTYQYASNTPIWAVDLDGLEAIFIHGTTSNPNRWKKNNIDVLMNLTNNTTPITAFSWQDLDAYTNNSQDRNKAAKRLVKLMKLYRSNYGTEKEFTLIGHSHGGNIAIQAAKLYYLETGKKVNIITISTPVYESKEKNLMEDPGTDLGKKAINDHIHLWNKIDGVQGGLSGEETYQNQNTKNYEIDVSKYYNPWQWKRAHSFDYDFPELIQNEIDNGNVKKLEKVNK